MKGFPAYLIRTDDPVLAREATQDLIHELVGDGDASLMVEDVEREDPEEAVAAAVDAAQTPPFLSERRVVVVRDIGRFTTDQAKPLVAYLGDPLPTTALVLVGGGGQIPRPLAEAVKQAGHIVDASAPQQARQRQQWVSQRIRQAGISLDKAATALVAAHLGEDIARIGALVEVLEAAYGPDATIGADELAPFLGEAGGVAPWALTDAIDQGDTAASLGHLRRLLHGGGRHPLQILGTLHGHYDRVLRLDGAGAADEAAAAKVLGITGSSFPARKALEQGRRLGHEGVTRAITLLARADLDLKGARDLPGEVVLEVLVARLSRLRRNPPRR